MKDIFSIHRSYLACFILPLVATFAGDADKDCKADGVDCDVKSYYENAAHYDKLWGEGNMGFGFYPHLDPADASRIILDFSQASLGLTERMIETAAIKKGSRVLDLGSGKGLACLAVARQVGAHCTGVDLTPANVARAKEFAELEPDLDVRYFVGSFTDLPTEVLADGLYDVIITRVAFCHVHSLLGDIFGQVKRAMKPGTGRAVINDFLGGDGEVSAATVENVYKRLHFEELKGPISWRRAADDAGLTLMRYEDLNAHIHFGYSQLEAGARKKGIASADGVLLADNYKETVAAVERREVNMNLALYGVL